MSGGRAPSPPSPPPPALRANATKTESNRGGRSWPRSLLNGAGPSAASTDLQVPSKRLRSPSRNSLPGFLCLAINLDKKPLIGSAYSASAWNRAM